MRGKKSRKASKEKTGKRTGENEPLKIYAITDRGETINIKAEGINKVGKILEGGNLPRESQLVLWPHLIMKLNP